MSRYQFNIQEGSQKATLTVESSDEESAIKRAQQLLKSSDSLGNPTQLSESQSRTTEEPAT